MQQEEAYCYCAGPSSNQQGIELRKRGKREESKIYIYTKKSTAHLSEIC